MTKPLEDGPIVPSSTAPLDNTIRDRKWNRGAQIAAIAGPIVAVLLVVATPLVDSLIPQRSSEGNSPTGVQSTGKGTTQLTLPAPSSTPPVNPITEPERDSATGNRSAATATTQLSDQSPSSAAKARPVTHPDEIVRTETRERTVERSFRNGHCEDPTNIRWEVRAAEGWQIDVTSLALVPSASSKSAYYGVSDLTNEGFTINGRVSNDGDCVRVLAQVYQRFHELACNQRVAGGREPLWHYKATKCRSGFGDSGNGSGQTTVRRVPPGLGSMPSAS